MYEGFSIKKFEKYMKQLVDRAEREKKPMLFINATRDLVRGRISGTG